MAMFRRPVEAGWREQRVAVPWLPAVAASPPGTSLQREEDIYVSTTLPASLWKSYPLARCVESSSNSVMSYRHTHIDLNKNVKKQTKLDCCKFGRQIHRSDRLRLTTVSPSQMLAQPLSSRQSHYYLIIGDIVSTLLSAASY